MINDWYNAYWLLIDVQCFAFGLMLCEIVFDWFICWVLDKSGFSNVVLRSTHKKNRILLSLSPHPRVILHAGLAWRCRIYCYKSVGNSSPWGKGCRQGGWGVAKKCFCPVLIQHLRRPPLSGGRGLFVGWWILRLRLRLRAEWQIGGDCWEEWTF